MEKPEIIYKHCMNSSFEKIHEEIALTFADRFGKKAREVYTIARYEKRQNIIKKILKTGIILSAEEKMMVKVINAAEELHLRAKIKLTDVFFLKEYLKENKDAKK